MSVLLNDVHSMLNPVRVGEIVQPTSLAEIRAAVCSARERGLKISIAGGRHAMGGQPFAAGALHLDMQLLNRVLDGDAERGVLHIEAGAERTWCAAGRPDPKHHRQQARERSRTAWVCRC